MCGICGFYTKNNITREQLGHMNDLMRHRGPDDSGIEMFPISGGYNIGLAHRRLSINDLSPMGHQPMTSPDGRVTIAFNGEIYNFVELKDQLNGYPYKGGSDTEVVLASYLKWGIRAIEHLDGMYAIAIYDRDSEKLYLIRDRIGKKPLYFWIEGGENLVFASELKPIMTCPGFNEHIRIDILPRYLYQQYINAPDTILENVYKLEPGTVLTFCKGKQSKWNYWNVREKYHVLSKNPIRDYNEAKNTLKELLKRSVTERLVADVPVGTFLSGGYDSSLVTAIAQEILTRPIKTFSIGFDDKEYDESLYAKAVSKQLDTKHTNLTIDEHMMLNQVSSIAEYYDEPMADSSQIPSMLVAELAKNDVSVVLTGDGGDEFFCGYATYDYVNIAQKLDLVGDIAYKVGNISYGGSKLIKRYPSKVRTIACNRNKQTKVQLALPEVVGYAYKFMKDGSELMSRSIPCLYTYEQDYGVSSWQIRRMLLDMDTYLPGDILTKVDRATMKYALEARCPLLDYKVMEYSYRIPLEYKYFHKDKKHILKDIAYDYIPRELLDRPKKGFSVPIEKWLKGSLKEQLMEYSDKSFLSQQGVFSPDYVSKFIYKYEANQFTDKTLNKRATNIIWSFFVFQQWYEKHISSNYVD